MLPSSHRLSTSDVSEIMKKGRFTHTPLFSIRLIESEGVTLIGAIVPTKVCKNAVGRNKLRRMIYLSVRKIYKNIKPNFKMAILAKSGALGQNQETVDLGIKEVLVKAKLLK